MTDMGHCVTHGIMSFGRHLVKSLFQHCSNNLNRDPSITLKANEFFTKYIGKNKINFIEVPTKGFEFLFDFFVFSLHIQIGRVRVFFSRVHAFFFLVY